MNTAADRERIDRARIARADPESALANVGGLLGLLRMINEGLGRDGQNQPTPQERREARRRGQGEPVEDKALGVSETMVDCLPYIRLEETHTGKQGECVVCCEDLKPGEVGMQIPCNHFFHPECIVPWLETHNTCPICRSELTKKAVRRLSAHALAPLRKEELMSLPLRELQRQVHVKGGDSKGSIVKEALAEMVINAPGKELFSSDSDDSDEDEGGEARRRVRHASLPYLGIPNLPASNVPLISPRIAAIAAGAIAAGISTGEALSPRRAALASQLAGQLDSREIIRRANSELQHNRPVFADPMEAARRRRESEQRLEVRIFLLLISL
jgi:hypothetical protein